MPKRNEKLSEEQVLILENLVETSDCGQDIKRAQAILMLEEHVSAQMLLKFTGIKTSYAYKLRKRFEKKGLAGILTKKRKPRSRLTKKQQLEILEAIKTSTPRDHEYESAFWNTAILADWIKEKYNVEFKSKSRFYILFKEAKFTYHKPDKQYKNRDPKQIEAWEKEIAPIIEEYMNNPEAILLTEDEMILTTQTTFQKIWLPEGEFPKIDVSNTRKRCCIYGFLNAKTGKEHAFKAVASNADETVRTLTEIEKIYPDGKIVIVWDNGPSHKNEKVKAFLRSRENKFHLIQLPPYAPEKNPQEHVWKAGRANVTHNKFIENIDAATDDFVSYLNNSTFQYKILNLPKL